MVAARIHRWRAGAIVAAFALGACGSTRLAIAPQPEANLSGQWILESGDDAARLIAAALPKPQVHKPSAQRDPELMIGDRGPGARRGGSSSGRGGGGQSQPAMTQAPDRPAAWGRLTPRDFVSAFVLPPERLDVAQQPALVRVGAGDRPRAFEPGDEQPVTVNDRYGSRAVRAGWIADAFVITSADGPRLNVVEQLRRNRDDRLERTVEFQAPQIHSIRVHSVYRRATPVELETTRLDGPPLPLR
jgi:hypothetical protein